MGHPVHASPRLNTLIIQRLASFEIRCLRKQLGIDYKLHTTDISVRKKGNKGYWETQQTCRDCEIKKTQVAWSHKECAFRAPSAEVVPEVDQERRGETSKFGQA